MRLGQCPSIWSFFFLKASLNQEIKTRSDDLLGLKAILKFFKVIGFDCVH